MLLMECCQKSEKQQDFENDEGLPDELLAAADSETEDDPLFSSSYFSTGSESDASVLYKHVTRSQAVVPKSAIIPEVVWQQVRQLKTMRELCVSQNDEKRLEMKTGKYFKFCHDDGRYNCALIFLMEQWLNYYMKKDLDKAAEFLDRKVKKYKQKHDTAWNSFDSLSHTRQAYIHGYKLNLDQAFSELHQVINDKTLLMTAQGRHIVFYCIGTCFINVLKMDYKLALSKGIYSKCLGFFPGEGFTSETFTGRYKELNHLREVTFRCFEFSRNMVIMSESEEKAKSRTVTSAYLDPTKPIFPLLHMAKVRLDYPVFPSCRVRFACSEEDIKSAEKCMDQVEFECSQIKLQQIPLRLMARKLLTYAELFYRKAMFSCNKRNSESNINEKLSRVKMAIDHVNSARKLLDDTLACIGTASYEEHKLASEFLTYLSKEYLPKLEAILNKLSSMPVTVLVPKIVPSQSDSGADDLLSSSDQFSENDQSEWSRLKSEQNPDSDSDRVF